MGCIVELTGYVLSAAREATAAKTGRKYAKMIVRQRDKSGAQAWNIFLLTPETMTFGSRLREGDRVRVTGEPTFRIHEGRHGEARLGLDLRADEIEVLR